LIFNKKKGSKAFRSILQQEIGWFDKKENNIGVLTTKLAVEVIKI
jgi:hypothetical protein